MVIALLFNVSSGDARPALYTCNMLKAVTNVSPFWDLQAGATAIITFYNNHNNMSLKAGEERVWAFCGEFNKKL